jgi:hypothetical protein
MAFSFRQSSALLYADYLLPSGICAGEPPAGNRADRAPGDVS